MRLRALVLVMGLVGPSWAGQMNDAQVRRWCDLFLAWVGFLLTLGFMLLSLMAGIAYGCSRGLPQEHRGPCFAFSLAGGVGTAALLVSACWRVGSPVLLLFSILAVPAVALGYRNRYSL